MSEDEARMLLENYRQQEETQGMLNQNPDKGRRYQVPKDW